MGRPKIHPTPDEKLEELKEWYGWDNEMLDIARKSRGIIGFYRIMLKEKDNGLSDKTAG